MSLYKISPSDLTFSWDGCKYCFYMKVKHNLVIRTPFPGIFGKMANLTSDFYQGKPASEISPSLPPGRVTLREKFVKSAAIIIPEVESQCYIFGRFDAVIAFEDGSYGVVDYKTSDPKEEHAAFYSRQLTAYAYALENPAAGALHLAPVTRMGLFVVTPERFEQTGDGGTAFINRTTWMGVPREDVSFLSLLEEVVRLLDAPTPPESDPECGVCNYRRDMGNLPVFPVG